MDKYIDNGETQIYGPKLRKNLDSEFVKSSAEVRRFLRYLTRLQANADKTMASAMGKSRVATSDLRTAAIEKSPAAEKARKLLTGLHKHLSSKQDIEEWDGDMKLFFPKGLTGVGQSASDLKSALRVAREGLGEDGSVPDAKKFIGLLGGAAARLKEESEKTGEAMKTAQRGLSEQSAEKKSWILRYRGIALIVEGVLTIEGRAKRLASVVPHLAVPSGKKKGATKKGSGTTTGGTG
ncbi:MAG: hypothetical protein HY720_27800 [Planctomycetes bacterium]|nr:hypothetical protein [Planctomycetota bacterium]